MDTTNKRYKSRNKNRRKGNPLCNKQSRGQRLRRQREKEAKSANVENEMEIETLDDAQQKMAALKVVSSIKCHGGYQWIYSHKSSELNCEMKFSLFMPPSMEGEKFPVLFYLSGLTCSEKNFIEKSGFQTYAAKHKIIVVGPDTSPRDCNIDGEDDSWDFGTGAGFYVDATEEKWKKHYRMYSYVMEELPSLIHKEFSTNGLMSIMGHSMGGHGALICTLKNPGKYKSVSAFSPICNPTKCPWGEKCFTGYLGNDAKSWEVYDATCLVKNYNGPAIEILIDQGSEDQFLHSGQLLPDNFSSACQGIKTVALQLRKQQGYDHSYYFISSFIEDHITFHAKHLNK